eukprot:5082460-Ditylum_brightwellii.AAC.1
MATENRLPHTYNQNQWFSSDTRERVDPHGKREYKFKELSVLKKKAIAGAFVDGNKNVILGFPTIYRESDWDGVLANPNDMQWYGNTE